jgi:hypothetical protein
MSGTSVSWYRNASLIATGTITTAIADTNGPLYIGNRTDLLLDRLGRLDDVAIFDEALSQSQISTIRGGDFSAFVVPVPEPGMLLVLPLLAVAAPFVVRRIKALAV